MHHGGTLHSYVSMLPDGFTFEFLDVGFISFQPRAALFKTEAEARAWLAGKAKA